jgi:hypothetical protein
MAIPIPFARLGKVGHHLTFHTIFSGSLVKKKKKKKNSPDTGAAIHASVG